MAGPTYDPATNTWITVIQPTTTTKTTKPKTTKPKTAPAPFVYKAPTTAAPTTAAPSTAGVALPAFNTSAATGYGEATGPGVPPPSFQIPKAGLHATQSQLINAIRRGQSQEDLLKQQLAYDSKKNRLPTQSEKVLITKRIRETEDGLNKLFADYLRQNKILPLDLLTYKQQTQTARGGLLVVVDISSDCSHFSNPGPTFTAGMTCYVRCQINNAPATTAGEQPQARDLIRVYWTDPPKSIFYPDDTVSPGGRDEYFVSYPLTITRMFRVTGTPTNKETWKVNVEAYEMTGWTLADP